MDELVEFTMNFTGCKIRSYHRRYVNELFCGGLRVTPHVIPWVSRNHSELLKPAPYCLPEDYAAILRELQQMAIDRNGIPLHLATDQEGDEQDVAQQAASFGAFDRTFEKALAKSRLVEFE